MVQAYVMVRTEAGTPGAVRAALADRQAIENAHVVAGDVDVIARIEGETVEDLLGAVTEEIHSIEGVTDTQTYVAKA